VQLGELFQQPGLALPGHPEHHQQPSGRTRGEQLVDGHERVVPVGELP
jgi:hypothetical protein